MPTLDGAVTQTLPILAPGSPGKAVFDRLNGMGVSKFGPDYLAMNLGGYLFGAATAAGQATVAALGTVATGICLSNAPGSGVVLVPTRLRAVPTTAIAAAGILQWCLSFSSTTGVTHTVALIVRSGLVRDIAAVSAPAWAGQADSSFTLPATQVVIDWHAGGAVAASSITPAYIDWEPKGEIVLMPGASLSTASLTTIITAGFSMKWLALPLQV